MTPARSHIYVAGHIGGNPENFPGSSSPVRFGPMSQDPPAQCLFLVSSSNTLTSLVFRSISAIFVGRQKEESSALLLFLILVCMMNCAAIRTDFQLHRFICSNFFNTAVNRNDILKVWRCIA
jgi:hypothetical protein